MELEDCEFESHENEASTVVVVNWKWYALSVWQEWRDRQTSDKTNVHMFSSYLPGLQNTGNLDFHTHSTPIEFCKLILSDELFDTVLQETNSNAN